MTERLLPSDKFETLVESSTLGNFDLSKLVLLLRQAEEWKIGGETILHRIMGAEITKFLGNDLPVREWIDAFVDAEFPLRRAIAAVYYQDPETDPIQRREELLNELNTHFSKQVERARQIPIINT